MITDAGGNVLEQTRYMPYGGKRGEGAGIMASNYLFTDQELDAESGLYNYDARLYDPIVGRFASADSLIPSFLKSQSFNRYSYCVNNPLKYTDPSGHNYGSIGPGGEIDFGGETANGNPSDAPDNAPKDSPGWTEHFRADPAEVCYDTEVNHYPGVDGSIVIEIIKHKVLKRKKKVIYNFGWKYRKIEYVTVKKEDIAPMIDIFNPNRPQPIDWENLPSDLKEAARRETLRALGVAGAAVGTVITVAAVGPEALVSFALTPNCANDFAGNLEPGPPSSFSPCGLAGYAVGNVIDSMIP